MILSESTHSVIVESWKLWNEGYSLLEISDKLNIHKQHIGHYLRMGNECGQCDYTPIISKKRTRLKNSIDKL